MGKFDLINGEFLEDTKKNKYVIKLDGNDVFLTLLDEEGNVPKTPKRRKFPIDSLKGLIRTRYFWKSKYPQRITHADLDATLEFSKNIPK